jgi:enoyl-CoA hydratase
LAEALRLAERITANAPLSVAISKQILRECTDWPAREIWERQRPMVESVLASKDAQEGARAFAEKRTPLWRGE